MQPMLISKANLFHSGNGCWLLKRIYIFHSGNGCWLLKPMLLQSGNRCRLSILWLLQSGHWCYNFARVVSSSRGSCVTAPLSVVTHEIDADAICWGWALLLRSQFFFARLPPYQESSRPRLEVFSWWLHWQPGIRHYTSVAYIFLKTI